MTDTLREKIARLIHEDQKQLLSDYDVHPEAYLSDPELYSSAQALADTVMRAILDAHPQQPAPSAAPTGPAHAPQAALSDTDDVYRRAIAHLKRCIDRGKNTRSKKTRG